MIIMYFNNSLQYAKCIIIGQYTKINTVYKDK